MTDDRPAPLADRLGLPDAAPPPRADDRLPVGPRLVGMWLGILLVCWLALLVIFLTTVAVVRWVW